MVKIAGIIHPNAYQKTDLMTLIGMSSPTTSYYKHKNLEMSSWNLEIVFNEKATSWIILDGKVENLDELRAGLLRQGINNYKRTEEIILKGYEVFGESFFQKIKGTFSFILYNEKTEQLLILRDRIGNKCLYWALQGGYFLFSNDLKSLLVAGVIPQVPAIDGIAAYFYFGYFPQDLTPIKGVYKLLPGYYLTINLDKQLSIHQYWSLSQQFEKKIDIEKENAVHKIEKNLRAHLENETPALSISPDLGTLFLAKHLAQKQDPLSALSIIFEGDSPLEFNFSRQCIQRQQVNYHEKILKPSEALNELISMVWHFGEPIGDPYSVYYWQLAKCAKEMGWSTICTSVGSHYLAMEDHISRKQNFDFKVTQYLAHHLSNHWLQKFLFSFLTLFNPSYKYRLLRNQTLNDQLLGFVLQQSMFSLRERKAATPFLYNYFNPEVFTQRFHKISQIPGTLDPLFYLAVKTSLPDNTLFALEKSCDAFGIQTLNPFLNQSLIEYMAEIPEDIKNASNQENLLYLLNKKYQERDLVAQHHSPDSLAFLNEWRLNSECRTVFSQLTAGLLGDENLVSVRWIKQELGYPYLVPSTFRQLWAILTLEIWFRLFINQPVEAAPPKISLKDFLS